MKKQINSILNSIKDSRGLSLRVIHAFLNKKTSRARAKILLHDLNNNKYVLEIARNKIEEFYLTRAVEIPQKIPGDNVIRALMHGVYDDYTYALFPFVSNNIERLHKHILMIKT